MCTWGYHNQTRVDKMIYQKLWVLCPKYLRLAMFCYCANPGLDCVSLNNMYLVSHLLPIGGRLV